MQRFLAHLAAWVVVVAGPTSLFPECLAAEPPAAPAPRSWQECLADLPNSDPLNRRRAARELARLGSAAAPAVPALLTALDDPDEPAREWAVMALTAIGEAALAPLQQQLAQLQPPGQRGALQAITNLRELATIGTAQAVWRLIAAADADEEVVSAAGEALYLLGPRAAALTPEMVELAFDQDDLTTARARAAQHAIRGLGEEFHRVLPLLAERLRAGVAGERLLEIERPLERFYPPPPAEHEPQLIPVLVELARHPSPVIHGHAFSGLALIGSRAAAAVPDLVRIARDESLVSRARYQAVRCLVRLAPSRAADTIMALSDVPSPAVRAAVVVSLAELKAAGVPRARRVLRVLAEDDEPAVRDLASALIESIGNPLPGGSTAAASEPAPDIQPPPTQLPAAETLDASLAARAVELESLLNQFMAPASATPPRQQLAEALVQVARLIPGYHQLRADLEQELSRPATGYFLARLEAIREETNRQNADAPPNDDHWTRVFRETSAVVLDDDRFEFEPFGSALPVLLKSELGDIPNDELPSSLSNTGVERMRIVLAILRKHEPALAQQMSRNLIPAVADSLLAERLHYLQFSSYLVLAREVPPLEQVPPVADRGRACADYLRQFIAYLAPARRLHSIYQQDLEISMNRFDDLQQRVLGATTEQLLKAREDATDTDPLLAWRDIVREHRPDDESLITSLILSITRPIIDNNQQDARSHLAAVYQAQQRFRLDDCDGNGVADYWTGDVSGLQRLLVNGQPLDLLASHVAALDARPMAASPQLALPLERDPEHQPAYLLAAVKLAADGQPIAPVAAGETAHRHPTRFAVCAYPRTYGRTGRQTYLITEAGPLRYKDTEGQPVERLPRDFEADEWTAAEDSAELLGIEAMSAQPPAMAMDDPKAVVDQAAQSTEQLVQLLQHDDDPQVRRAAAWALSVVRGVQFDPETRGRVVADLEPLLAAPTDFAAADVQRAAEVGALFDPPAIELKEALLTGLEDAARRWDLHPAALSMADALAKAGGRDALLSLFRRLCDESQTDWSSPGGLGPELSFSVRGLSSHFVGDDEAGRLLANAMQKLASHGERVGERAFGTAFAAWYQGNAQPLLDLVRDAARFGGFKTYGRVALAVLTKVAGDAPEAEALAWEVIGDPFLGDKAVDLLLAAKRTGTAERLHGELLSLRGDTSYKVELRRLFRAEALVRAGGSIDQVRDIYNELLGGVYSVDAIRSLGRIGQLAAEWAPRLRQAAQGQGPLIATNDQRLSHFQQVAAASALLHIAGDEQTALAAAMRTLDADASNLEAVLLLIDLGEAGSSAAPMLLETLHRPDSPQGDFVEAAIEALAALGPAARQGLVALRDEHAAADSLVYRCAVQVLTPTETSPALLHQP